MVGVKGQVSSSKEPSIEHNVEVQGERDDDMLTLSLSDLLGELLQSGIDMSELKVTHGKNWDLFVDVIVSRNAVQGTQPLMS